MKKNIYKVSQSIVVDYDTYDSFIVVAKSAKDAQSYHPETNFHNVGWKYGADSQDSWVSFNQRHLTKVEYIGKAGAKINYGIILCSYNAG